MSDVIQYASQIGRLDLVSTILASLVVVGIFGFLEIRTRSKKEASDVAERNAKIVAERVANEYLQNSLPEMLETYKELVKNAIYNSESDKVADSQKKN